MKCLKSIVLLSLFVVNLGYASSLYYVVSASYGSIKALRNKPNVYQLQLKQVNPMVYYFYDRPYRKAGMINPMKMMNSWQLRKEQLGVHRNASLQVSTGKKDLTFTLVLLKGRYNKNRNSLTFEVKPLMGKHQLNEITQLKNASLFIDS